MSACIKVLCEIIPRQPIHSSCRLDAFSTAEFANEGSAVISYAMCAVEKLLAAAQADAHAQQGASQVIVFQLSCLCGAFKASYSRLQPMLWETFLHTANTCLGIMDKFHTDTEIIICVLKLARGLAEGSFVHLNVSISYHVIP